MGIFNTLVDFTVLNILLVGLAVHGGIPLLICNAASFAMANLNSYLLNKRWTFEDRRRENFRQFLVFLLFSLGGVAVNCLVLFLLTSFDPAFIGDRRLLWINLAKVIATGASMTWNFLSYRHFVFRDTSTRETERNLEKNGLKGTGSSTTANSPLAGPDKR